MDFKQNVSHRYANTYDNARRFGKSNKRHPRSRKLPDIHQKYNNEKSVSPYRQRIKLLNEKFNLVKKDQNRKQEISRP